MAEPGLAHRRLPGRSERSIPVPAAERRQRPGAIRSSGAPPRTTCKDIDVEFPLGRFVSVTGVSGSGKSSLVQEILSRRSHARAARHPARLRACTSDIEGIEHIDKVIDIDQSPIGRTPRSNPATYTKVFDEIRQLFAATPESRMRGYKPGRFSFNVAGGRCEACKGEGTMQDRDALPARRLRPLRDLQGKALQPRHPRGDVYKGHSIADVLDMSVEEALQFFENQPGSPAILRDALRRRPRLHPPGPARADALGRRGAAGEAGRASWRSDRPAARSTSSTSRRPDSTSRTSASCSACCNASSTPGNTVVVIEHNLDVVKTADWVIDLGPEGGDGGGAVVAEGTPEDVALVAESHTGVFLGAILRQPAV